LSVKTQLCALRDRSAYLELPSHTGGIGTIPGDRGSSLPALPAECTYLLRVTDGAVETGGVLPERRIVLWLAREEVAPR
jgi:hypothetical protein